jgi:fibronectin type 3 domain-containing protein
MEVVSAPRSFLDGTRGGGRAAAAWLAAALAVVTANGAARAQECGVWLPVPSAGTGLLGVGQGGGRFVAVGSAGAHTSADGQAWTSREAAFGAAVVLRTAWNGAQWAAVGVGGAIFTSTDGESWTRRSSPTTAVLAGVAWGNGVWVAVGERETVVTSPDGIAWSEVRSAASGYLTSVIWAASKFLAVGEDGTVLTSADGTVWSRTAVAGETWLTDVVWSGLRYVAVAFDGTVLTSPTGASWTPRAETGAPLRRLLWTGAKYIAVGDGNAIISSPDLGTWEPELIDGAVPEGSLTGLAWNGAVAVAVGSPSGILRSHCGAWADFAFAPAAPQIGQNTTFHVTKSQGIGRVRWDFGEVGCDGAAPVRELVCLGNPCTFETTFAFASAGEKTVRLLGWAGEVDGSDNRVFVLLRTRTVQVVPAGACQTCLPPGEPAGAAPAGLAVVPGGQVALRWSAPATGTPPFAYDVELDGATVCQGIAAPECTAAGVAERQAPHEWRVRARNACGDRLSPLWYFVACSAAAPPAAAFTWAPAGPLPSWPAQQQPFAGQEVTFTDASTNGPDEWAWSGLGAGLQPAPSARITWWATGGRDVGLRAANCRGWSSELVRTVTVHPDVRPRRLAFDFGEDASPVAAGFTRVRTADAYTPARGYGWAAGMVTARDRRAGGDLERDFHFTTAATFAVDVPARVYDVTVWLGDPTRAHDQMALVVGGRTWDVVSTAAGEVARRVVRVEVPDGHLAVRVQDLGGSDPNAVLNGIEAVEAGPVRVDLGTPSSPVAAGFAGASEETRFAEPRRCGWLSGRLASRDRTGGGDLLRDFVLTQDASFACALAPGAWDVAVTLGDEAAGHDRMGVSIAGGPPVEVTTAARLHRTVRQRVAVADGELAVRFQDLGGADVNVVVNAVEAARVGPFDFGAPGSPVAPGYVGVHHGTRYLSAAGYGWIEGAVGSRDRGGPDPLTRDLVTTTGATFAVDLPNGAWDVTLMTGDAAAAHDEIGVLLEGAEAAVLSVARGQTQSRVFRTVVADGQLSVRIEDRGGADANAVLLALAVAPAPR